MQSVKLDLTKWELYPRANVAEINEGVWLALSSTARIWPLRRRSLWFLGSVSFSSFKGLSVFGSLSQSGRGWAAHFYTAGSSEAVPVMSSEPRPKSVSSFRNSRREAETEATLAKTRGREKRCSSKTAKRGLARFLAFSRDQVCSKNDRVQFGAPLCEG